MERDYIIRGQVDSSVVVGVVVILAIASVAVFGVYYFGFVRPDRGELDDAKSSATQTLNRTLGKVNTSQATVAVATYKARIQEADSKEGVTSVVNNIVSAYKREAKREELLSLVENATKGSFYELSDVYADLKSEINDSSTLDGLKELENTIESTVNSAWRDLHTKAINDIPDDDLVMLQADSPLSEAYMPKENATSLVQEESWPVLRELKFRETNTFEVPIVDTFRRVPTVEENSNVDIYEYENGNLIRRVKNTKVLQIIYPMKTLSSIDWSFIEDNPLQHRYLTDVWKEIKASEAGSYEASSDWSDWAQSVIEIAREKANLGYYDLQAIYVVEVTEDEIAKNLMQIEQYQSESKDVLILDRK